MGKGIGGIKIEHLTLKGSHFYPCGASLYRTLKLELERYIIMMGVTSTRRSRFSKRYRNIHSIKDDITKTTEIVEVQTLGKGEFL